MSKRKKECIEKTKDHSSKSSFLPIPVEENDVSWIFDGGRFDDLTLRKKSFDFSESPF